MDGGHWGRRGRRGGRSVEQVLRSVREGRREVEARRQAVWPSLWGTKIQMFILRINPSLE